MDEDDHTTPSSSNTGNGTMWWKDDLVQFKDDLIGVFHNVQVGEMSYFELTNSKFDLNFSFIGQRCGFSLEWL